MTAYDRCDELEVFGVETDDKSFLVTVLGQQTKVASCIQVPSDTIFDVKIQDSNTVAALTERGFLVYNQHYFYDYLHTLLADYQSYEDSGRKVPDYEQQKLKNLIGGTSMREVMAGVARLAYVESKVQNMAMRVLNQLTDELMEHDEVSCRWEI